MAYQNAASDRHIPPDADERTMKKIRIDCHLHTKYSPDSISPIEDLADQARRIGLDKLIITDHNTIAGAMILKKRYPDFVIVGEEIQTTCGEILAYFVEEEIPPWLEPEEAFQRLTAQNAFISLSHPYAFSRMGWTEPEMLRYQPYLDAIETANGRNTPRLNQKAADFANAHGLAATAGSDGHAVHELGRMGLELPDFHTADEMRLAVREATVFGDESSLLVRFYSRKAVLLKKLHLK